MKKTEKTVRLMIEQGLIKDMLKWDDPNWHVPSPKNCSECMRNFTRIMNENLTEIALLTPEQQIVFYREIVQKKRLIETLFCNNEIEYYELKLNFELQNLKQQELDAKKKLEGLSVTALLEILGLNKIHANGTNREIGIAIGKFFFKTKNSNKDLMFNIEAVDLATFVEVMIESSEGKSVKHHTMEGYIGEGRNN